MKRLGLLMCALTIGLGTPDVANAGHRRDEGPPPWAAAHGYRYKQEKRYSGPAYDSRQSRRHYPQARHRRDDHDDVRWRTPTHRWKTPPQESAWIDAVIGDLLDGSARAAIAPRYAPDRPWAPPRHASPLPPFSSLGGGSLVPSGHYCREFSRNALIGGRPQEIYGVVCRQRDGSWKVVSEDWR